MITFRYQPQFADYLAFNRHALWKMFRMPAIFGMLALLASVADPLVQHGLNGQGAPADAGGMVKGLARILLPVPLVIVVLYYAMWRAWTRSDMLKAAREFEIGEDGIRVWSPSFNGSLDWQHFEYAEEAGGYFFLKTTQRAYHYFPVSAVPDRDALVALLRSKLAKTKIRG